MVEAFVALDLSSLRNVVPAVPSSEGHMKVLSCRFLLTFDFQMMMSSNATREPSTNG